MAAVLVPTPADGRQARLAAAVDAVVGVAIDGLDEPGLRGELVASERHVRRLRARSTNLAAALAEHQGRGCPQSPEVRAACVPLVCHHWVEHQYDSGGRR